MNRFWVWIAGTFALGVLLTGFSTYSIGLAAPGLIILALVIAVLPLQLPYRQHLALAGMFMGMGVMFAEMATPQPDLDPLYRWCQAQNSAKSGEKSLQLPVVLEGVITKADMVLADAEYAVFVLKTEQFTDGDKTFPIRSKVRITWTNPEYPVYAGQRVRVEGLLKNQLGTFNFGIQGIETYYHRQGIFTSLSLPLWSKIEILDEGAYSPWRWIGQLRQLEAEALNKAVPEQALPFVYTVWLGERRGFAGDAYEKYLKTGTAHILAVSGVHVGIIYISLSLLLGIGLRNRKYRAILIIAAVWLFALLAGARVSSVRAAMMITLFLSAELFDREPDASTTLGQSAFLFLFFQPMLLFDIGFLLSFSSVGSLIFFSSRTNTLLNFTPWWARNSLSPVLAVQILPFPLVSAFFHVLPLVGPLINLLVIPLLSVVLWLCLFTSLLGLLVPPVAPLFGYAIQPVVALIESAAELTSQLPGTFIQITAPTPLAAACYWGAVFCLAHAMVTQKKPRRFAILGLCLLIFSALVWRPYQSPGIDFLDVGHGDAAVVRTPGGTTLLIDGGDRSPYVDYGGRVVVPYLYRHGITHLDYVVMTHPDRDHVGGLLHTLENISVGMALLPAMPSDRELEAELLRLCELKGVPVQRCKRGDKIKVKGATIEVLAPDLEHVFADVNNNSLVLRVQWPGMNALFTGDIEEEAEAVLADRDCRAAVLKVPHHGSHTSSSEVFLKAVNPSIGVVSTKGSSRRSAVHPEVKARYDSLDIPLFQTDRSGGIRIRQEEGMLFFQGARKAYGVDLSPAME